MKSWAAPAAMIVGLEYAVAMLIGLQVGFHYSIPFDAYLIAGLIVASVGYFLIIAFRLARRDFTKPLPWGFAVGVVLVALQMAVLNWLKIMLPLAAGFWADPMLSKADAALFVIDPWQVAYFLFSWAGPVIDRAYITWAPVKFAALTLVLLLPEAHKKSRALLSYFLVVSVGALSQYLLPSAGPIFYERLGLGDRFSGMPVQPWVERTSAYLWSDYQQIGGHLGTGISAMPSLHVAIALWMALVLRSYARRLQVLGFLYFGLIFIGSIYLGWHYALDSIAGVALVIVSWRLAKRRDHVTAQAIPASPGAVR